MWQDGQFDFISGSSVFPWSRLSSNQSQEMKNLTVGPWLPILSYRSFYRTPRIIVPNSYLHSALVLAHTSTWSNQNVSCQHSGLQILDRHQHPTLRLSKSIFGSTQWRFPVPIHLISLPTRASEPLITPSTNLKFPPLFLIANIWRSTSTLRTSRKPS